MSKFVKSSKWIILTQLRKRKSLYNKNSVQAQPNISTNL
jgi:hypothetical protein